MEFSDEYLDAVADGSFTWNDVQALVAEVRRLRQELYMRDVERLEQNQPTMAQRMKDEGRVFRSLVDHECAGCGSRGRVHRPWCNDLPAGAPTA